MLVKAAFVQPVAAGFEPYERALFVLSDADFRVFGVEGTQEFLPGKRRRVVIRPKGERLPENLESLYAERGFVARVMSAGRKGRFAESTSATNLDKAVNYWLLLRAPLRGHNGHVITDGPLRGLTVPVLDVLAVYPVVESDVEVAAITTRLRQEDRPLFRQCYTEHRAESLIRAGRESGQPGNYLAQTYRLWGFLMGLPICPALLAAGEQRYSLCERTGTWEASLNEAYRILAQTTCTPRTDYTVAALPFADTAREMSDATEYGTFGWELPVAMLDLPYEFVGPCANPGTVVQGDGAAMERRFPFWAIDLLARRIYPKTLPEHPDRAISVVKESIRHIEARNYRAFIHYDGERPMEGENYRFSFDRDGFLPVGSTAYSRRVVEAAVTRRYQEHELVRTGASPTIFVGEDRWTNFYRAVAGFLGVHLSPLVYSFQREGGMGVRQAIDHVCHGLPGVSETGASMVCVRHRHQMSNDLAALCLAMRGRLLPVNPPSTEERPVEGQLRLTRSQARASRMIAQWPVSVVLGNPGTGKTFATLQEMHRFAEELNEHFPMALIVLTPTNKAALRVAEVFGRDVVQFFGMGDFEDTSSTQDKSGVVVSVGTVDSFLRKLAASESFRYGLRDRRLLIGIDEAGMLTQEKFSEILAQFRDPDDPAGIGNVLRIVLLGDTAQLESVEPGNFLQDAAAAFPVTMLVEQQRYDGALVALFDSLRRGMAIGGSVERAQVVDLLTAHADGRQQDDHLKVYLIDDLPQNRPPSPFENKEYWDRFGLQVCSSVRDIIFQEILAWKGTRLRSGGSTPRYPEQDRRVSRDARDDYERFYGAVVQPTYDYRVTTLTRKPASERTVFVSSANRINGWFVDALLGRMPQPPGWKPVPNYRLEKLVEVGHPGFVDGKIYPEALRRAEKLGPIALDRFLYNHQPNNLLFCPGWPYVVQTNEFKRFGVVRKEVVRYMHVSSGRRRRHVFRNEDGKEIAIPEDLFRSRPRRAFSYGWAINVHQTQGSEFPLVIQVWLDGLAPGYIHHRWDRIAGDGSSITPISIDPTEALDAHLDLRGFYTAVTRTNTTPTKHLVADGAGSAAPGVGRCVIIAGRYALRRFLSLGVYPRSTPFNAALQAQLGHG